MRPEGLDRAQYAKARDRFLSLQLLNTSKEVVTSRLQIGDRFVETQVPANSVQTVRVQP